MYLSSQKHVLYLDIRRCAIS